MLLHRELDKDLQEPGERMSLWSSLTGRAVANAVPGVRMAPGLLNMKDGFSNYQTKLGLWLVF